MATASSDSSSTAADAQTWVYPPGGAPYPPLAATSNFGPVHQLDWMIMQWTPSNTPDELHLVCLSALSGAHLPSQPFQYQFDVNVPLVNTSDTAICHLYFVPSRVGNTVVWEYMNSKAASGITTYSSGATSSTAVPTVTVTTPIGLAGISSSTTVTTVPDPSSFASSYTPSTTVAATSSGTGLSTGASAGIGVGVALGAIAIAAALACVLWRRKKSNRQQWQAHSGVGGPDSNQHFHEGKDGTGNVIYGGELQGNESTVAELDDTRALRMAKNAAPRELAGHEVASELPR
ncbi:hypothetical protein LTR56_001162 [Elasticomyces elasticus]|nr:hypothetical protein LTR22_016198 [Elasticomyces elasticus]KAK3659798.1 hypothetical protein LTR56_001162 [Elasticomyces elasticus]KAK5769083.1 hypothetical protein LTS12_000797 [Elasticomyces elasticus]